MESASRWIFIVLAAVLAWIYVPKFFGGGSDAVQPIGPGKTETAIFSTSEQPPTKCTLTGKRFSANVSTRDAALVDYRLTGDPRFMENGKEVELTTVPGSAPDRFIFHFDWRAMGTTGDNAQMGADVVDYVLVSSSDSSCVFRYEDANVSLEKTYRVGERPYEVVVEATVKNRSEAPRLHRLGVENTVWRLAKETESHLGQRAPLTTEVACGHDEGKLTRKSAGDFAAKDFEQPEFEHGWYVQRGTTNFAANANAYFAQAVVSLEAPAAPVCALQVEERWFRDQYRDKSSDPNFGSMYRSRLVYPAKELAPQESATYRVLGYIGPKDRTTLAAAGGGAHHLSGLIDLGMVPIIGRVLVGFLIRAYGLLGNWGLAIILLTITVRIVLFPLTWKQIKSMVGMRQLKPEFDEINRKFKDEPQQKQLAIMELYRKHGVSPFGGCLPLLLQLPVWWGVYTVIQTAVELYHTPFLWLDDLSAADPYFVLPVVIGAMSFLQQKIMPQQADPAQQKMMLYFMPALFTVMMLFLPSGLAVYILTNSVLGIVQQLVVERFAPRTPSKGITIREKGDPGQGGDTQGKGDKRLGRAVPARLKGGS